MRETSCASAFGALEPCTETQCVPDAAAVAPWSALGHGQVRRTPRIVQARFILVFEAAARFHILSWPVRLCPRVS